MIAHKSDKVHNKKKIHTVTKLTIVLNYKICMFKESYESISKNRDLVTEFKKEDPYSGFQKSETTLKSLRFKMYCKPRNKQSLRINCLFSSKNS